MLSLSHNVAMQRVLSLSRICHTLLHVSLFVMMDIYYFPQCKL